MLENQRDDLVVILAGYKARMDTFFLSNPGLSSRIAHHLDFPDYAHAELLQIGDKMLAGMNYRFGGEARETFGQYLSLRLAQPQFANARSVRNALDRMRLRQASRLSADHDHDRVLGVDGFGESAPAGDLYAHFGLTAAHLAQLVAARCGPHSRRSAEDEPNVVRSSN